MIQKNHLPFLPTGVMMIRTIAQRSCLDTSSAVSLSQRCRLASFSPYELRHPRALKPRKKTTDAVFAAPSGLELCPILFCKNPSRSRRWDSKAFLPPILPCANPNWLTPIPRHADSVHWNLQFATRERCTLVPDHFRHYHMLAGETPEKKHDVYLCCVIPAGAN